MTQQEILNSLMGKTITSIGAVKMGIYTQITIQTNDGSTVIINAETLHPSKISGLVLSIQKS